MKYNSQAAKQRLLQIPVAAIRCGNPESGISRTFLMEHLVSDCDHLYQTIIEFYLDGMKKSVSSGPQMTKDNLGQLLALAQSDRERECIKYAVFKTSGLSASAAWKFYGFSDITQVAEEVEAHFQTSLTSEELDVLFQEISSLPAVSCYDSFLMNLSYRAFLVSSAQSFTEEQRADLVNGLIITDSEKENPELWSQAAEVETEKRKLVQKQ